MPDWIPGPDAEALGFFQTFAATTAANQGVYFLQGSDVASIQSAVALAIRRARPTGTGVFRP